MKCRRRNAAGAMSALAAVCAVALGACAWSGRTARASVATGRTGERLEYASPMEMLFSPDGTRALRTVPGECAGSGAGCEELRSW